MFTFVSKTFSRRLTLKLYLKFEFWAPSNGTHLVAAWTPALVSRVSSRDRELVYKRIYLFIYFISTQNDLLNVDNSLKSRAFWAWGWKYGMRWNIKTLIHVLFTSITFISILRLRFPKIKHILRIFQSLIFVYQLWKSIDCPNGCHKLIILAISSRF